MKKFIFLLIAFLSLCFFISSVSVSATILTLNPDKDAYVVQSSANVNFGTSATLELIERTATGREKTYLNFPLNLTSNLINIFESKVCLYELSAGTTDSASLYYLYNDWKNTSGTNIINETQITWNTQPCGTAFDNSSNCNLTALSTLTNLTNAGTWNCWNVPLNLTLAYYNSNLSFVIVTPDVSNKFVDVFTSKENVTIKPYIYINYSLHTTPPDINFVSPTETSGQNASRHNIQVNVTAIDDFGLQNITIRLYNSTNSLIGIQTTFTSPNSANFTNLSYDLYFFNATARDNANNFNATATRNFTLSCIENWVLNYTACNILDNKSINYYDSNSCGTNNSLPIDNGTILSCDYCIPSWTCSLFDNVCHTSPFPSILNCLNATDTNLPTCCSQTNLSSDCVVSLLTLSKPCGNLSQFLNVPSYPYVPFNQSYPMEYFIYINQEPTYVGNMSININETNSTSTFNFVWDNSSSSYKLTLLFTTLGDYPFTIFAHYPYVHNVSGTFLVRNYFNVRYCGFLQSNGNPYINNYAYITAEFLGTKKYNPTLEMFFNPLTFRYANKSVFYAPYLNGCANLTLYEKDDYAVRLIDGNILFPTTYSVPNITEAYGTNIYFGTFHLNTNQSYNIIITDKDLHPYRWLANWLLIIGIIFSIALGIGLFIAFPMYPFISLIGGIGFTIVLIILRVLTWLLWGF